MIKTYDYKKASEEANEAYVKQIKSTIDQVLASEKHLNKLDKEEFEELHKALTGLDEYSDTTASEKAGYLLDPYGELFSGAIEESFESCKAYDYSWFLTKHNQAIEKAEHCKA